MRVSGANELGTCSISIALTQRGRSAGCRWHRDSGCSIERLTLTTCFSSSPGEISVTEPTPAWSRFWPIYRRNLLVWRKLAPASLVGNVVEPLITLLAFGYGLGSLLREVEGVPYIAFLAAGSLCMSATMAARPSAVLILPA